MLVEYRARQDREPVWLGLILEQATDTLRCEPSAFRDYGLDNGEARYLGPVYEGPRGLVQWVRVEALLPDEVRALLFPPECGEGRHERSLERLLKSRIGLDASSVGSAVIERAVRQRMSGLALHDEDEYWMRLNGSPGEVQALIEAVVVPETWFFRYPESFTTLARLAFERLPSLGGGRALRILSLPCSTGEEPYSIVMALLDAGLSEYLFEVDALDVSARVIERASLGCTAGIPSAAMNWGFATAISAGCRWLPVGRAGSPQVRFRCGNLLDPGLLAGEAPYDFVFCRNLLIYFDRPTQSEVVEVLKRLLRPDGAMFIGPAEASLLSQHGMQPIGVPLSFVFRRTSEAPAARPKAVSDGARPVVAAAAERASVRPSPPPPAKPRQRLSSLVPPASGQPSPVPSASSTKSPAWRMPASTARRAPPASANWPRVGRRPRSSTGSGCSAMSPGRSRKPRISTARPCTWSRSTPRRWRTWRRCSPLAATMPAPGACSNVRPVE